MLVIGIVGGVASGKSSVAKHFEQFGAAVIDADLVGHDVLCDEEVKAAIRQRWGNAVFDESGNVDRAAVARIVFARTPDGPKQLTYLEELTHPRIARRLQQIVKLHRDDGTTPAVVLDAAVLLKAGWDQFCDRIVFVDAPREVRFGRCAQRGWTAEQFAARQAAQPPLEQQRRRADWVVDNTLSPQDTRAAVQQIWDAICK